MSFFNVIKSCDFTSARSGELITEHGKIQTPCFMPIGTYSTVKSLSANEIKLLNYNLLLSNTYHLYLRPGIEILEKFNGLHNFINWDGSILTDSGGFQIYSLSKFRKIDNNGVEFKSHLDGSTHYFSPEKIIDIQRYIGSDIMMVLDVCPDANASINEHKKAVQLTTQWAKKCLNYYNKVGPKYNYQQFISPIIQGGTNKKLRIQSAQELLALNAPMYAIGGLAVGEPKDEMLATVELLSTIMPIKKPRYLMGVGTPIDLIECIRMGIDMFDCVIPTRNGRNGQIFTENGPINIKNAKFRDDITFINHPHPFAKKYTKSYIHHLFRVREILGCRIATELNLSFYNKIMIESRKAINENSFNNWSKSFISKYTQE
tara:strand:- start:337 stop:1458 length:1122 start_codon:yes stop_codon:yes gene_type:complete